MNRPSLLHPFAALGLALLATLPFPVRAAEDEAPADARDPRALAVLRDMFAVLHESKSYSFDTSMRMDMPQNDEMAALGMPASMTMKMGMILEKPNRFVMTMENEGLMAMMNQRMTSDGKSMTIFSPGTNSWFRTDAPADISALASMGNAGSFGGNPLLGAGDLSPDEALEDIVSAEYVGEEVLDGVPVHRIRARQGSDDMPFVMLSDFWIRKAAPTVLLKFVPDMSSMFEAMAGELEGVEGLGPDGENPMAAMMQMKMEVLYSGWKVGEELPDSTFVFTAPEGSREVEDMSEIMGLGGLGEFGSDEGAGEDDPAAALEGKPAPALDLELLDGGSYSLASRKGKVVVLDFWATWCGPCVKAMPLIDSAVKKFEEKGVELVAVNLMEEAGEIRAFLKKQKLKVNVALDVDGVASEAYLAAAIPQTVLVGKDGVVRKVWVGFDPKMDQSLSAEIEKALAE